MLFSARHIRLLSYRRAVKSIHALLIFCSLRGFQMYNLKSAAVHQTQRETLQSYADTQGVTILLDTPVPIG